MKRLLAAALLFSGGCLNISYVEGDPIDWAAAGRIVPGTTTRSGVLSMLGAPINYQSPVALAEFLGDQGLDPGSYAGYPYTDIFVYQLSQGDIRGWTVIFYTEIDVAMRSDLLLVFFDEREVVTHVAVRKAVEDEE